MAKRENPNLIPKKFRNLGKTFTENLTNEKNPYFLPFPKGVSFYGKEKDEEIILVVRSHWIKYLPFVAVSLLMLFFPFLLSLLDTAFSENTVLFLAFFIPCLTFSLSVIVYAFIKWFYNVNIITDKRIIDLDFTSVASHSFSEARLEKIEDITHKQLGLVGSLFDVGTVYFQTAGATAEIEFNTITKPRIIQDILYDLLDSKKKRKI
jgi:hypothetical protein